MDNKSFVYTIYNGYNEVGIVKTLKDARALTEQEVKKHNLPYKCLCEARVETQDIDGRNCKIWHRTYQYSTKYFETFIIVGRLAW